MIIINNKRFYVPVTSKGSGIYTLKMKGVDNVPYSFTAEDKKNLDNYCYFNLDLDIPKGEYDYTLFDDKHKKVGCGLIRLDNHIKRTDVIVKKEYDSVNETEKGLIQTKTIY